jgi:hypothetical protein
MEKMLMLEILIGLSITSMCIPVMILSAKFRMLDTPLKWLLLYLLLSLLSDAISFWLVRSALNPNIVSSIYLICSTASISLFFYSAIDWKTLKLPLFLVNILYFLFALYNFLLIQITELNSFTLIFQGFAILLLSIFFYYKLLKELPAQQLQKLPLFWIVSGFFFTYAGKLAIFSVAHYLIHFERDDLVILWSIYNMLSIIGNILIAYGAWLNHRQLRSTSLSL